MLVGALYNIVDQIFIGQKIGEAGNAATNIAFPLSTSNVALALLFGIGAAAAFNLAMGQGKQEEAIHYIGNALTLLFVSGLVLTAITHIFLEPLLIFFGAPNDEVLQHALTYTRITTIGFPFLIFTTGASHLIRADGNPKYAMFSTLAGAVLNTILDPIFIFGFNMDMAGAAWATIIGQFVSFLLVLRYFKFFNSGNLVKEHFVIKWIYAKRIISLGTTPAFNQIAMMVVQITMNNSLSYYGSLSKYGSSIPLAVSGIVIKVATIFFAVIIGISQGMQPIVGYNYGAKNYTRVRKVFNLAIKYGFLIALIGFLLFQIIPGPIISIFGKGTSQHYTDFAIRYFRIYMFFTFINFMQPISSNFFTSIGKPKKGIFLSLTRQIIFLLPLIVIFPKIFDGIDGIMYAGPVADFAAATVATIMVLHEFRLMKKQEEELENKIQQAIS
ncbi:MAG: MATE family efflux transporter [Clostridiaceae bacterium]|nr:MATE family efflux transporter [Clostridiaceae bacterium]